MNDELYEVACPDGIVRGAFAKVTVPGSKSITNRALLLAAMAQGTSTLRGCLTSEDAVYFLECLQTLDFPIASRDGVVSITGYGGKIPKKQAEINVGSAGTAARFLAAMLAFSDGVYTLLSSEQMKRRPMQPLIASLREAGAEITCLEEDGHFPLQITGARKKGRIPDTFRVDIAQSSQFLSALLIAAGTLGKKAEIIASGTHGMRYVLMTAAMMESFGVRAKRSETNGEVRYCLTGDEHYRAVDYRIEPDMSAAAYFYALAALLGVEITVEGAKLPMLQGDVEFLKVLEQMGCSVIARQKEPITVFGPKDGVLRGGFCFDLSAFSDQALTLAAMAPFANAPIRITGIAHIRLQECDRIRAIKENLTALGIKVAEEDEGVTIFPGDTHGCEIETYEDHRVAMAFSLTGLRTKGVRIRNPYCCKKTFAEYFSVLEETLSALAQAGKGEENGA